MCMGCIGSGVEGGGVHMVWKCVCGVEVCMCACGVEVCACGLIHVIINI